MSILEHCECVCDCLDLLEPLPDSLLSEGLVTHWSAQELHSILPDAGDTPVKGIISNHLVWEPDCGLGEGWRMNCGRG